MKQLYTLGVALLLCTPFKGFSQCSDVQSDLSYAYSHVKDAFEANNLTHLQYYANRSLKAFERAQDKFKTCKCEVANNLTYDNIETLEKVDRAKTFEDARFFIKRAIEGAKNTMNALDKCTAVGASDLPLVNNSTSLASATPSAPIITSSSVSNDQLKLAEQKELELRQIKQLLIGQNKAIVLSNIEVYNKALEICDCKSEVLDITQNEEENELISKSIDQIKSHYLNTLKQLTASYLSQLNQCADND
ncbi:hypothetical protein [Formosa sp. S-31]|uniref:hypothetical protein n=1 Tax=Formosa sp. S-31 TaxID=2790949 RepID=UPI003EC0989E